MAKQVITRKDGIVYERKCKEPTKLTKCLCLRVDDNTFNKLKKEGVPSKIIKKLINEYLESEMK